MININLRDIFLEYTLDCLVEIPDSEKETFINNLTKELADVYIESQREENAYQRRLYRHKAHYSLDLNDDIETKARL